MNRSEHLRPSNGKVYTSGHSFKKEGVNEAAFNLKYNILRLFWVLYCCPYT